MTAEFPSDNRKGRPPKKNQVFKRYGLFGLTVTAIFDIGTHKSYDVGMVCP